MNEEEPEEDNMRQAAPNITEVAAQSTDPGSPSVENGLTISSGANTSPDNEVVREAEQANKQSSAQNNENYSLDQLFLYQNLQTGVPSKTPLTLRQLCRLLCPPSETARFSLVTPQTPLLPVYTDSQTGAIHYGSTWKAAKDIPCVSYALAQWYYCVEKDKTTALTEGPMSTRELYNLWQTSSTIHHHTRFYSADLVPQWTVLADLPVLLQVLEAYSDNPIRTIDNEQPSSQQTESKVELENSSQVRKNGAAKEVQEVDEKDDGDDDLDDFFAATEESTSGHNSEGQNGASRNGSLVDNNDKGDADKNEDEDEDEGYTSDYGTYYVKDKRTGQWVQSGGYNSQSNAENEKAVTVTTSAAKPSSTASSLAAKELKAQAIASKARKKRKKPAFSAKNAKCWIYMTGLPPDVDEVELSTFCSKVGILDLDPATQKAKIKIYRHKEEGPMHGMCKGDASVCYARPESVELALKVLDEAPLRPTNLQAPCIVRVDRAHFQASNSASGSNEDGQPARRRKVVSSQQRQLVKLATAQAMDWDEGVFNGRLTGGRKGLRIIVVKGLFSPHEMARQNDDNGSDGGEAENSKLLEELESDLRTHCEPFGVVEKMTVFTKHPDGVVVIKFTTPGAASDAIKGMNGLKWKGRRQLEASFWDGVTDYTARSEEDEQKEREEQELRHSEFEDWLENQELPEELRLHAEYD
jgi:HIV Tat-specific factor 1